MTRTPKTQDPGPDTTGGTTRVNPETPPGITCTERLAVLAGPALAATWTAVAAVLGTGMEIAGMLSLAAIGWTVVSSLALALRRGIRRGDWSAFRRPRLHDGRDERIDAATNSGQYAHLEIAEEHERMMRDD